MKRDILMEISDCDICNSSMNRSFITYDYKGFPCNVSMCENCGLVKLNPRWKESKYRRFYSSKYDFFYRGPDISVEELFKLDLTSKGHILKDRVKNITLPQNLKILDIGCGTGFSFFSLPEDKKIESYAIEGSKKCIPFLTSKGISVIGTDFSCDLGGEYNLIIARHVLEHTLNPINFLTKIRNSLTKEGYLYLAVPNAMQFSKKKANSFFRHIHTYYFNIRTLLQLCEKAGLYAIHSGCEGDIWVILQCGITKYSIPYVSPHDQLKVIIDIANYNRFPLKSRIASFLKRVYYWAF